MKPVPKNGGLFHLMYVTMALRAAQSAPSTYYLIEKKMRKNVEQVNQFDFPETHIVSFDTINWQLSNLAKQYRLKFIDYVIIATGIFQPSVTAL